MEAIEGLRFLASLPLAGTGRTEGGEKMQPFNRFHSRLFTQQRWQQMSYRLRYHAHWPSLATWESSHNLRQPFFTNSVCEVIIFLLILVVKIINASTTFYSFFSLYQEFFPFCR